MRVVFKLLKGGSISSRSENLYQEAFDLIGPSFTLDFFFSPYHFIWMISTFLKPKAIVSIVYPCGFVGYCLAFIDNLSQF